MDIYWKQCLLNNSSQFNSFDIDTDILDFRHELYTRCKNKNHFMTIMNMKSFPHIEDLFKLTSNRNMYIGYYPISYCDTFLHIQNEDTNEIYRQILPNNVNLVNHIQKIIMKKIFISKDELRLCLIDIKNYLDIPESKWKYIMLYTKLLNVFYNKGIDNINKQYSFWSLYFTIHSHLQSNSMNIYNTHIQQVLDYIIIHFHIELLKKIKIITK